MILTYTGGLMIHEVESPRVSSVSQKTGDFKKILLPRNRHDHAGPYLSRGTAGQRSVQAIWMRHFVPEFFAHLFQCAQNPEVHGNHFFLRRDPSITIATITAIGNEEEKGDDWVVAGRGSVVEFGRGVGGILI